MNTNVNTSEEVAREVWDFLGAKLDNPDEKLSDNDFLRRFLYIQRRNTALNLLALNIAYEKALAKLAAHQATGKKDAAKAGALAEDVTRAAQEMTDLEFRLKAVIKLETEGRADKLVEAHYGSVDPAAKV